MKFCIIEDDQYKVEYISRFLKISYPSCSIVVAMSYREAATLLRDWSGGPVLLDMQLPLYAGAPNEKLYAFGGERILRNLERAQSSLRVVVITQYTTFSEHFDEVDFTALVKRLYEKCPTVFIGAIQFLKGESKAWQDQLSEILRNYFEE